MYLDGEIHDYSCNLVLFHEDSILPLRALRPLREYLAGQEGYAMSVEE
jgi:hypothetical protein